MTDKVALLTHSDLDAVGAAIILKRLFTYTHQRSCGYGKIDKMLNDLYDEGVETLVVADLSFTEDQLAFALDHFDQVHYFDHHLQSEAHLNVGRSNFYPRIVNGKSSALLAWEAIEQWLGDGPEKIALKRIAEAVDAYDLWQHVEKPHSFSLGYDLNLILNEIGFDLFEVQFAGGLTKEAYGKYKDIILHKRNTIAKECADTDCFDVHAAGSKLFFLTDPALVNDFTLQFPDHRIYYMIYKSSREGYRLSIRVGGKYPSVDMTKVLGILDERLPMYKQDIVSKGGHAHACGINFTDDTDLDIIEELVFDIDVLVAEIFGQA